MPDISMCVNEKCKFKHSCYRYMAIPEQIQTYAAFEVINDKCEYYLPVNMETNSDKQTKVN